MDIDKQKENYSKSNFMTISREPRMIKYRKACVSEYCRLDLIKFQFKNII